MNVISLNNMASAIIKWILKHLKEKRKIYYHRDNLKPHLKPVVGRTLVTQRCPYPNLRQNNFTDMVKVMDANQ